MAADINTVGDASKHSLEHQFGLGVVAFGPVQANLTPNLPQWSVQVAATIRLALAFICSKYITSLERLQLLPRLAARPLPAHARLSVLAPNPPRTGVGCRIGDCRRSE